MRGFKVFNVQFSVFSFLILAAVLQAAGQSTFSTPIKYSSDPVRDQSRINILTGNSNLLALNTGSGTLNVSGFTFTMPASITMGANTFARSGAHNLTITTTGTTDLTFPTSGILSTLAGVETFAGKTISGASNTLINLNASNLSSGTVPLARLYTTLAGYGIIDAQPLDSDLTSIAAINTTSYGRSLLAAADASGLRNLGGLVIGTNVQAYDAELAALASNTGSVDLSGITLILSTASVRSALDGGSGDLNLSGYDLTLPDGVANSQTPRWVNLVAEGDSLSTDTVADYPWTSYINVNGMTVFNHAAGGDTVQNMVTTYTSQIHPHAPSVTGKSAVFVLWGGYNDINNASRTAVELYGDLSTLWALARADGFTVVAFTLQPGEITGASGYYNGARELIRQDTNTLILGDQSKYDYLVRPDLLFPDPEDDDIYPDGVHISTAAEEQLWDEMQTTGSYSIGIINDSPWRRSFGNPDDIFFDGGNIGINVGIDGMIPHGGKLQVGGSIWSDAPETNTTFNGGGEWGNTANFVGTGAYWAIRTGDAHSYNIDVNNSGSPLKALTVLQNGCVGVNGAINTNGKFQVGGSIYANSLETDTIFDGGGSWADNANIVGGGAYWAVRTGSAHDVNIDVNNSGSPINAFKVRQDGSVGILGKIEFGSGFAYGDHAGDGVWQTSGLLVGGAGCSFDNGSITTSGGGALTAGSFAGDGTLISGVLKEGAAYNVIAAGTAYTLTTSYTNVDFGTTDPITPALDAGDYNLYCYFTTSLATATTTSGQSIKAKFRRTNNTAADIGFAVSDPMPVLAAASADGPTVRVGPYPYTAGASGDTITIQAELSSSITGTATITNCVIQAIPK